MVTALIDRVFYGKWVLPVSKFLAFNLLVYDCSVRDSLLTLS